MMIHPFAGQIFRRWHGLGRYSNRAGSGGGGAARRRVRPLRRYARYPCGRVRGGADGPKGSRPIAPESCIGHRICHEGTDVSDSIEPRDIAEMRSRFEGAHPRRCGFAIPNRPLILEAASVEAIGSPRKVKYESPI